MTLLKPARFLALAASALLAGGLAAAPVTPALAADDPPTASVSGQVTDAATGAPLERIEVALDNVDDSMNGRGGMFTDADGRFRFDAVDPSTWILRVTDYDGRYVAADSGDFTVADGQQVTGKDFRLVVGATITGVAVDDRTGSTDFDRSICGGAFKGRSDDSAGQSDCADLGDDGRWFVRALPAGRYTVNVGRDTTHTALWAPAAATQAGAAAYTVAAGQTLDIGTQRLRAGGTVTGRVTNRAGQPVENVVIGLMGPECEPVCDLFAETDADGRYRIGNIDVGSGWYLSFIAPGQPYAWQWSGGASEPASARRFRTGFETTTTLNAVLRPEARVDVTVTGTKPGYYTSVSAYTVSGDHIGNGGFVGGAETGTATITGLPAGRVKIQVISTDEYDNDRTTVWYGGTSQETATPVPVAPGRASAVTVHLPG
jgi:hypothetical protein